MRDCETFNLNLSIKNAIKLIIKNSTSNNKENLEKTLSSLILNLFNFFLLNIRKSLIIKIINFIDPMICINKICLLLNLSFVVILKYPIIKILMKDIKINAINEIYMLVVFL